MGASGGTLLTGQGIEAFAFLQVYHKLKIQVEGPDNMRWRVPPGPTVRQIMGSSTRNLSKLLEEYQEWLIERGYLVKSPDGS